MGMKWSRLMPAAAAACALALAGNAGAQTRGPGHGPVADIVGGEVAPSGRYPWVVALVLASNSDSTKAQWCGASLIGPKHLLTAAHCLGVKLEAFVGSQRLGDGGRRIQIVKITKHPKYNALNDENDVAVLELAEAVTGVAPVRFISTVEQEQRAAPPRQLVSTAGWGDTTDGGAGSLDLREVAVPVVDRAACNSKPMYPKQISAVEMCAGYAEGGKDSCQGDSGGPLFRRAASAGKDVLVGVVSWGAGCAMKNKPGVYARLATLGQWVREQLPKANSAAR